MAAALSLIEKSNFDLLKERGYFYLENKIRGEIVRMKITKEDLHNFINYDMSFGKHIYLMYPVMYVYGIPLVIFFHSSQNARHYLSFNMSWNCR
jgi:hypothetical protein